MAYNTTKTNKNGIVRDETNTTKIYAEDWNDLVEVVDTNINPYVVVSQDGDGDFNGTDSATIQTAINSISLTGGTVFVKKGTYNISNTINIKDKITLYFDNNAKISVPDAFNKSVITNSDTIIGNSNIIIKNITIEGNKINQTSGRGILLDNVTYFKIIGCKITDIYQDGINCRNGCANGEIKNNYVNSYDNIIVLTNCDKNILVHSNICVGIPTSSTTGKLISVVTTTGTTSHISIIGNICRDHVSDGVQVWNNGGTVTDVVVASNICDNVDCGVHFKGGARSVINGNKIRNCLNNTNKYGIQVDGLSTDLIISNNEISDTYSDGILLSSVQRINVIGNSIRGNYTGGSGNGIFVNSDSSDIIISNNRVLDMNETGIMVDGTANANNYININNNLIKNNTNAGINVRKQNYGLICNNNIVIGNGTVGIELRGCVNFSCSANNVANSGSEGIILRQDTTTSTECINGIISSNNCYDNQSTKTQTYGFSIIDTSDYNIITNNCFLTNKTGSINNTSSGINNEISHNIEN